MILINNTNKTYTFNLSGKKSFMCVAKKRYNGKDLPKGVLEEKEIVVAVKKGLLSIQPDKTEKSFGKKSVVKETKKFN